MVEAPDRSQVLVRAPRGQLDDPPHAGRPSRGDHVALVFRLARTAGPEQENRLDAGHRGGKGVWLAEVDGDRVQAIRAGQGRLGGGVEGPSRLVAESAQLVEEGAANRPARTRHQDHSRHSHARPWSVKDTLRAGYDSSAPQEASGSLGG